MDSSVEEAVGFALQREIFAFPTRVMQRAADWKIKASGKTFIISPSARSEGATVSLWVTSKFSASWTFRDDDRIFAAPAYVGRLPWSADSLNDAYRKAGKTSGVHNMSTHTMRHTYRSWLDAVGTPIAVQRKLMRHADIRTTMNVYGDVVTDEMSTAQSRVVGFALNGSRA
jgi:hypothetical protein